MGDGDYSLSSIFCLHHTLRNTMGQLIVNLAPTTETEAVNAMLSVIGEAPVTDASTSTQADVQMAYNLLTWATRELQSEPWKFNSETGVELAPTNTLVWQDSSGAATLLNVFKVPTGLSQWKLTPCPQNGALDMVQSPSRQYQEASAPVLILYDRARNRDGADAALYPLVYIDAIHTFNFEMLPETARRYVTVIAGRRFAQQILGSTTLSGFQETDEKLAYRAFKRDQGEQEDFNMLDTYDAQCILGGRMRTYGGYMRAVYPGPNAVPVPVRSSDLSDVRVVD